MTATTLDEEARRASHHPGRRAGLGRARLHRVPRVLGPVLVNPEIRVRVLACAEDLCYRPNRAASALIAGRTHNIGLIVSGIANPSA